MKTMSMVSFMLFFFIGISISMLTCQTNYHQQTSAQSYMTNIEEEKTSAKKYNNNNNFIIEISTEEGTDADDGLSNQELCNKYLEEEGCKISGSTTITTTEQNVTQRLEEKLLQGKPQSIPAPPQSPPTIPFASSSNDSFSISDAPLASNSTG
jgi:hypothetical protein